MVNQPPGTYTYNQLAEETNLSYQQFYKIVHELNDELLTAKLIKQALVLSNTGITTTNLTLTIDEYRCFLLENSLPLQLLRPLLLEPELDLEEFCRRQFVSRSKSLKPRRILMANLFLACLLWKNFVGKLASYNSDLDFLLENNPQFDLTVYDSLLPLSAEEAKGEAASVYFLANFYLFMKAKNTRRSSRPL